MPAENSQPGIADCLPLMRAVKEGIISAGILQPFVQFGRKDSTPAGLCAKSIGANLKAGQDFKAALQNASPRLPGALEKVLITSGNKGVLDYALDEVLALAADNADEEELSQKLETLASKYTPRGEVIICSACFERDFAKLLARARTEKAEEVILEQEEERYFHQKFVAAKLVQVIEPSHSGTIRTFRKALEHAGESNEALKVGGETFKVKKLDADGFSLVKNGMQILKIVFGK